MIQAQDLRHLLTRPRANIFLEAAPPHRQERPSRTSGALRCHVDPVHTFYCSRWYTKETPHKKQDGSQILINMGAICQPSTIKSGDLVKTLWVSRSQKEVVMALKRGAPARGYDTGTRPPSSLDAPARQHVFGGSASPSTGKVKSNKWCSKMSCGSSPHFFIVPSGTKKRHRTRSKMDPRS